MAKPATEARLAAAANGFTEIIDRGNAHIITKNPTTGKCCYDGQVGGGWHYNGDQETDTAWEQDAVAEYLKMVKAGYNLRARKLFNAGDLIQWIDPGSGQYVKFQPQNFQWIDGTTGSNSLISVAQAVASPSIDDDKLYWPAAFGAGRHFRYTASPTKLIKHLIIDSAANLPACPTWITNPWLELTFTLTPSSGVTIYVDGVAWDQATTKTTANAIEFRLPSGQVVWQLAAPTAYDSSEMAESCVGQIRLYVNKKIKYCSVRFPKAWIDSVPQANYPIIIDPTVDYQVGGSDNDGLAFSYNSQLIKNGNIGWGKNSSGYSYSMYLLFSGVTIPASATITTSYITFVYFGEVGTGASGRLYFEKAASPVIPSSYANYYAKTRSTNYVTVTRRAGTWNSSSINAIVQEVVDAYDYSDGSTILVLIDQNTASNNNYYSPNSYDNDAAKACSIHIEYTEAAGGKPAANVIWIG